eukprot:6179843-Pleurochrysis_carterae.AAC.1
MAAYLRLTVPATASQHLSEYCDTTPSDRPAERHATAQTALKHAACIYDARARPVSCKSGECVVTGVPVTARTTRQTILCPEPFQTQLQSVETASVVVGFAYGLRRSEVN